MRYTDTPTTPRPPSPPEQAPPPTNDDIINQLIRIETRLVKLMHHSGLDANGRPRDDY